MNFSSMEYFEALAQERSFTRAAERLHITQQSLSSHIAKLEKELNCQLIVRRVPLELTYAGEVFLRYASSLREQYTAMQQEFWDISQNQQGALRVGIAFTRGRTILPGIITEFQKEQPSIRIEIVEASNEALRRKLVDGDLDLAIAYFPSPLPGVTLSDFYTEEVVVMVARELFTSLYAETSGEHIERLETGDYSALEGCPLLLGRVEDIGGRIERDMLQRVGIMNPRIAATSSNSETLLALCVRNAGACLCSESLAKATLAPEQLERLLTIRLGDSARYPIRFGYQAQSHQWSILESFMKIAREQINSLIEP